MDSRQAIALAVLLGLVIGALSTLLSSFIRERLARRRADLALLRYAQPYFIKEKLHGSPVEAANIGTIIHSVFRRQENECDCYSLSWLQHIGGKAFACYEWLGRCLVLLDALATCAWGCSKGDHIFERLLMRASNSIRGAIRLAFMGFYDEALAQIRTSGEIANLLSLFAVRGELFDRWKSIDERTRRKEFSPASVRALLEEIATPISISTDLYGEFSVRAVHVNPATAPQAYDHIGKPKASAFFQEAGLLLCLNEASRALTFILYGAAHLTHLDKSYRIRILRIGADLARNTGNVTLDQLDEMWAKLYGKRTEPNLPAE